MVGLLGGEAFLRVNWICGLGGEVEVGDDSWMLVRVCCLERVFVVVGYLLFYLPFELKDSK